MRPTAYEVMVTVRFSDNGQAVMDDIRERVKGVPREQANAEKTEFQARVRVTATNGDSGSDVRKLIEECASARGMTAEIQIGEVRAVEWEG